MKRLFLIVITCCVGISLIAEVGHRRQRSGQLLETIGEQFKDLLLEHAHMMSEISAAQELYVNTVSEFMEGDGFFKTASNEQLKKLAQLQQETISSLRDCKEKLHTTTQQIQRCKMSVESQAISKK